MENLYFYLFEFGAIFTIAFIFFKEWKNKKLRETLVLAVLYGMILEVLNVHLSGTYYYGNEFFLEIFNIPLVIGAGWAIVYYLAEKSSGNYNLKWWQIPFFMSIIALSIDLIIDVVAIRLGFWNWVIPLNQEWFGVPYDNLFGWLVVIWTFSFFINLSEQKFLSKRLAKVIKYLSVIVSPIALAFQIISYTMLSAFISAKFTLGELFDLYKQGDYSYAYYPEVQNIKAYFFWIIVFLLVLYFLKEIYKNKKKVIVKVDIFSLIILFFLHSFFLVIIVLNGFYREHFVIILFPLFIIIFHIIIFLFPIYIFRKGR